MYGILGYRLEHAFDGLLAHPVEARDELRKSLVFSEGTELVILFVLDVLCHYFLVFLNILPAQRVIDCSGEVFYQAYNSSWCEASPKMQRMLVMIMRKIIKPCVLSAGNVFSVSFEMFASILDLLERIKKDWQSLKSEEELEVLRKYSEEGRLFTKFYSSTLSDLRFEQVL
ncbi:hypothetical protein KM043_007896 [Ampulex compressa]|nr:hypothetical protein KM043_007896 [Ampulex compressa]